MKRTIEALKGNEILFDATHVVEFFSPPLPTSIDTLDIATEADLFRLSHLSGYDEIFISQGKTIEGECAGKRYTFAIEDFLRWQLERVNEDTLWQLINKTDASVTEILDNEAEYERDPDYYPEGWLNVYAKDEYPGRALAYIKRLREEVPDQFYGVLIESMLDEHYGLLNRDWYEIEIAENLEQVRFSYGAWAVPLMIVSTGKFHPYISTNNGGSLMMDDYDLIHMYVRNYDEGEPR